MRSRRAVCTNGWQPKAHQTRRCALRSASPRARHSTKRTDDVVLTFAVGTRDLTSAMSTAVANLLRLLDLEPLEVNLFRGTSPQTTMQRVFGGQVIGQALVAAVRTVEGMMPHSLHAYFLLAGDPKVPIVYEVDRIRDGKSFTTRRVVAIQHGHAIFSMSVSFHNDEEAGIDHQMKMPDVPHPDQLPSDAEIREKILPTLPEAVRRYYERIRPIELRPVDFGRYIGKPQQDNLYNIWF